MKIGHGKFIPLLMFMGHSIFFMCSKKRWNKKNYTCQINQKHLKFMVYRLNICESVIKLVHKFTAWCTLSWYDPLL